MTHRRRNAAIVATVLAGAVGFGWVRAGTTEPTYEQTDLSNLWQITVGRPPESLDATEVKIVLRVNDLRTSDSPPQTRTTPLRAGIGRDRLLTSDTSSERPSATDGRLTLQLLDLRQFGVDADSSNSLRVQGVFRVQGARSRLGAKLEGHSMRGPITFHRENWRDGELPLMTFTTVSTTGYHEHTFLASVLPDL